MIPEIYSEKGMTGEPTFIGVCEGFCRARSEVPIFIGFARACGAEQLCHIYLSPDETGN